MQNGIEAWQANAEFWDSFMGETSNDFHRNLVRPKVTQLLNPNKDDLILDAACGNGNYSAYLSQKGVKVVAFDYSSNLISLAKKRWEKHLDNIEFNIADATDEESILKLKKDKPFTKAVSNMAVMDIADIRPLFKALGKLLAKDGIFVFATQHPCFVTLTEKYMTSHCCKGVAIEGQPKENLYFHRSLQDIFNICFENGFIIDGFFEECYMDKEIPEIIIVRARKIN